MMHMIFATLDLKSPTGARLLSSISDRTIRLSQVVAGISCVLDQRSTKTVKVFIYRRSP